MQKHINISIKRKNAVLQEKFDPTINFDSTINFDFFDLITWDSLTVKA